MQSGGTSDDVGVKLLSAGVGLLLLLLLLRLLRLLLLLKYPQEVGRAICVCVCVCVCERERDLRGKQCCVSGQSNLGAGCGICRLCTTHSWMELREMN